MFTSNRWVKWRIHVPVTNHKRIKLRGKRNVGRRGKGWRAEEIIDLFL
jgi:hypothetical protein